MISAFWQLGTSTGSAWRPKSSTWATTGESGAISSPFKVEKRKLLEKMTACSQDNTRDQRRWSSTWSRSSVFQPQQSWRDENQGRGGEDKSESWVITFLSGVWGGLERCVWLAFRWWWGGSLRCNQHNKVWGERKANTIEFIKPFIRQRRELLYSKVVNERGYKLFFVESICEDEAIIEANIRFIFYFVLIEGE